MKDYDVDKIKYFENKVYKQAIKMKGSISAEHGIGFLKRNKLKVIKSSTTIKIMKNLKEMFDPNNILNPYKMLDQVYIIYILYAIKFYILIFRDTI